MIPSDKKTEESSSRPTMGTSTASAVIVAEEDLMVAKRSVFHEGAEVVRVPTTVASTTNGSRKNTATINKDVLATVGMFRDETAAILGAVDDTEVKTTKEEDSAVLEEKPNSASIITGLPMPPLVSSQQVQRISSPGAFPSAVEPPRDPNANQGIQEEEGTIRMGDDPEDLLVLPLHSNGLTQATPVELPTGTAEPMDQEERKTASSYMLLNALFCFSFLAVIGIGLTIFLVSKNEEDNTPDTTSSDVGHASSNSSASPDDFWDWELPFQIPSAALRMEFEQDTNHVSPVSKAFQWSKNDPNLHTYSESRNLQRFVLALFYFSTSGDNWIQKGNEIVSVIVELPDFVITHYLGRGGSGEQRHLKEMEDASRTLQQGNGVCGGATQATQVSGGVKQVNISAQPWLSYNHSECEWFSTAPPANLTACSGEQELVALDLELNNLAGRLPKEITLFHSLQTLNLWGNGIHTNFFTEFGTMTNLRYFDTRKNHLTGTIPSQIGLLSHLWHLGINQNSMTGSLPEEIWSLSNLKQIHIGDNQFTGSIPNDIGYRVPKLRTLRLRQNEFTGTLPTSLGLLSDLWGLPLWTNHFSGTLPTQLGNLSKLQHLLLQGNQMSGSVPSELGKVPLVQLQLTGNSAIVGTLPSELGFLHDTLYGMDIRGTSISGTVPERLCSVPCLSFDCSPTLCGCDCPCGNFTLV